MTIREADATLDDDRIDGYSPAKRFLLYLVAQRVNAQHGWQLFAAPTTLADQVGIHQGTVRTMLKSFVRDGWLAVHTPGGGRGNHTIYRWETVRETARETARAPAETARGASETARGADPDYLLTEGRTCAKGEPRGGAPDAAAGFAAMRESLAGAQ